MRGYPKGLKDLGNGFQRKDETRSQVFIVPYILASALCPYPCGGLSRLLYFLPCCWCSTSREAASRGPGMRRANHGALEDDSVRSRRHTRPAIFLRPLPWTRETRRSTSPRLRGSDLAWRGLTKGHHSRQPPAQPFGQAIVGRRRRAPHAAGR